MSYFCVKPVGLREQSCELQKVSCHMRTATEELALVIRGLQTMSCYDRVIQTLRHAAQKGETQYVQIRQCARTLDSVAELYAQTELKNHTDRAAIKRVAHVNTPLSQPVKLVVTPDCWTRIEPVKMLPLAEELFGAKVIIPDAGKQGGI